MTKIRVLLALLLTFSLMTPTLAGTESWPDLERALVELDDYYAAIHKKMSTYRQGLRSLKRDRTQVLRNKQAVACKEPNSYECEKYTSFAEASRAEEKRYEGYYDTMYRANKRLPRLYGNMQKCAERYSYMHKVWRKAVDNCYRKTELLDCGDTTRFKHETHTVGLYRKMIKFKNQCKALIAGLRSEARALEELPNLVPNLH